MALLIEPNEIPIPSEVERNMTYVYHPQLYNLKQCCNKIYHCYRIAATIL